MYPCCCIVTHLVQADIVMTRVTEFMPSRSDRFLIVNLVLLLLLPPSAKPTVCAAITGTTSSSQLQSAASMGVAMSKPLTSTRNTFQRRVPLHFTSSAAEDTVSSATSTPHVLGGVHRHTWVRRCWALYPGLLTCQASSLLTELHPKSRYVV